MISIKKVLELGGAEVEPTSIPLSEALEVYWDISKDLIIGKSENQIRKWRNPRIKAINNMIRLCGDKSLKGLVRNDILALKDWWIERINHEGKKVASANKDLGKIKIIITDVSKHLNLELKLQWLFDDMKLSTKGKASKRAAFDVDFVQNKILDISFHAEINDEAKYFIYAMAETGARIHELIGLDPKDIVLEEDIPHIKIRPNKHRTLKSEESERDIPLVGCSLWAFKHLPNGFEHYRNQKSGAENMSAVLRKHFKAKNLLPTDKHTPYSLRHSFQDRLTNLDVPDRIQCQLMGHRFRDRIEYGKGATLKKKQEWLLKMCFKKLSN